METTTTCIFVRRWVSPDTGIRYEIRCGNPAVGIWADAGLCALDTRRHACHTADPLCDADGHPRPAHPDSIVSVYSPIVQRYVRLDTPEGAAGFAAALDNRRGRAYRRRRFDGIHATHHATHSAADHAAAV